MAIETAIVMPVLLLFSLGAFQISNVVARQVELQTAVAEASQVAIASVPDTLAKRTTLHDVIVASTGLATSSVVVTEAFRCSKDTAFVDTKAECGSKTVSDYVKIELSDTYVPTWAKYGLEGTMNYSVVRYVMVKQEAH